MVKLYGSPSSHTDSPPFLGAESGNFLARRRWERRRPRQPWARRPLFVHRCVERSVRRLALPVTKGSVVRPLRPDEPTERAASPMRLARRPRRRPSRA